MRIGDLELYLLDDGRVRVDAGGPFGLIPRRLYERYLAPDEDHQVPMSLRCLLVRSEGKTILIDTGLGTKMTPEMAAMWDLERHGLGLLPSLESLGVGADDVDMVINTHLHADHCGGNTTWHHGEPVATFPRATYWVQRIEWAEACHPDSRTRNTYFESNFAPLMASGQMRLMHGDTQVTRHVRCIVTPGHTRGHQSVVLETEGWRGLFVSDMATYAIHMTRAAWLTAYDVLPLENIRTKQRWQRWAAESGAWLFFEHDPEVAVATLVARGRKFTAMPVPEADALRTGIPTPTRIPG
jgi:glyoxylase-like metal-dependent hydrolase (beta-lactamase superfamily II)